MTEKKENKLVSKLIRMEEKTVQDIENIQEKFYKDEYVSFSAIVRRILRIGIDNFKKEDK